MNEKTEDFPYEGVVIELFEEDYNFCVIFVKSEKRKEKKKKR